VLVALPGCSSTEPSGQRPVLEDSYALDPAEGVFAYSRISPDGRLLAYASEARDAGPNDIFGRVVTVVDLEEQQVLFTAPGIDPYWSTDGDRMIYLSTEGGTYSVVIRDQATGVTTRDIAPVGLGDYFSWGVRDDKDLILTIRSRYYYLNGNAAVLPEAVVPACEGIGVGERPLLSRDGQRITTFVQGTLVIRNLTDCDFIFDTGIGGAKADFSADGRYVAFHAPKVSGSGYDVEVVDLEERTVRTITDRLAGSSYFPSWTDDGRLSFRYDGPEYRGFMMASDLLVAPARPLPTASQRVPTERRWSDLFPETALPETELTLVMIWSTWSAHSPDALMDLQRARDYFARRAMDVSIRTATDPGSLPSDMKLLLSRHRIDLPRIPLAAGRLRLTEAHNQVPATLLFRRGRLVDRRLGAQTYEELNRWVTSVR
jgi:hypothetical protein